MFGIVGEINWDKAATEPQNRGIKTNEEAEMGFKREKMRASECP